MLTPAQKKKIAKFLNKKVDIPGVPDFFEQAIFAKAVDLLDAQLSSVLPPQVGKLLKSADGIDTKNRKTFAKSLTKIINKNVDIPLVNEKTEGIIIGAFVDVLVSAMGKNKTLNKLIK